MRQLILGGPGCGKTAYQIAQVEEALGRGVPPGRIAFVSFTKAAVEEARNRAKEQFNLEDRDLPYFRTLHSLCFREMNLRRSDVMGSEDWAAIARAAGVTFSDKDPGEESLPGDGATEGDRALSVLSYAHAARASLQEVYHHFGEDLRWEVLLRLEQAIAMYKGDTGRIDFSDMLTSFIKQGRALPIDLAIIDEAQDLTAAQWAVARRAFTCPALLISGDDDQAIHTWAGAATRMFQGLTLPRLVLPVSHRLSREVWEVAQGIAGRISQRFPKQWAPAEHSGRVQKVAMLEDVDIDPKAGSWMILARNRYQLREVARHLRGLGLLYRTRMRASVPAAHIRAIQSWERWRRGAVELEEAAMEFAGRRARTEDLWYDALTQIPLMDREYYRTALRAGYRLQDEPNILISTIHGVKGMEADRVILLTDITKKIATSMETSPDAEHRVFFVGATRARFSLTIVAAEQADLGYAI